MSTENLNSEVETNNAIEDSIVWEDSTKEDVASSAAVEPLVLDNTVSDAKEEIVITADEATDTKPSIVSIDNGIIGTGNAEVKPKPKRSETKDNSEKVALFSERNVFWEGVGRVGKGYNIVDAKDAEKWLTRKFVRLATPEEIKQEFGK
jgi:hypothetical protein